MEKMKNKHILDTKKAMSVNSVRILDFKFQPPHVTKLFFLIFNWNFLFLLWTFELLRTDGRPWKLYFCGKKDASYHDSEIRYHKTWPFLIGTQFCVAVRWKTHNGRKLLLCEIEIFFRKRVVWIIPDKTLNLIIVIE